MVRRSDEKRHTYLYIVLTFIFLIVLPGSLLSYLGLTTLGQEQVQIEKRMKDEHLRLLDLVIRELEVHFQKIDQVIVDELMPAALRNVPSEELERTAVRLAESDPLISDAFVMDAKGKVLYPFPQDFRHRRPDLVEFLAAPSLLAHSTEKSDDLKKLHVERGNLLDRYRKACLHHSSGDLDSALAGFRRVASASKQANADLAALSNNAVGKILFTRGQAEVAREAFIKTAGGNVQISERDADWYNGMEFPARLSAYFMWEESASGQDGDEDRGKPLLEILDVLLDDGIGATGINGLELADIVLDMLESLHVEGKLNRKNRERLAFLTARARRVKGAGLLANMLETSLREELDKKLGDDGKHAGERLGYSNSDENGSYKIIYQIARCPESGFIAAGFVLDKVVFRNETLPRLLAAERFPENIIVAAVEDTGKIISGAVPMEDRPPHLSVALPQPYADTTLQVFFRDPDELSRIFKRGKILNIARILVLLVFLLLGVFLVLRIIRREIELARLRAGFVSNVSHELKTPLTSIRMFGEMLKLDRVPDGQKRHEYYGIIAAESERLTKLIDNVLDFARLEAGRESYTFTKANPTEVVDRALQVFSYYMKEHDFEVNSELDENLPAVLMDREAVSRAVLNLLSNAVKYSREEDRVINVSVKRSGNNIRIGVRDHGIGMEPDVMERIFEKFYRVGNKDIPETSGTGLGLTLVKAIASAHGGRVEVQSKKGKGSIFTIILPVDGPSG